MKYWRGYLTAGIILACTWALREFARAHTTLVDMIYPYVTRMMASFMSDWSAGLDYCLWQVLLVLGVVVLLAIVVLVAVFKWNPIQWGGWVCAAVAAIIFLNTVMYGLNGFSGPLAEDIRLEETDYAIAELEQAAIYYRDQANALADQVQRDGNGDVIYGDFDTLSVQAADGFDHLVYQESLSVFAGPMDPVKKLGWADYYTQQGITGLTVGLTGEAAVNPQTPAVLMPFAMCREMARRMSIVIPRDASFAALMACKANEDMQFQYTGALLSYRYCILALAELDAVTGADTAKQVRAGENANVLHDLNVCSGFYGTDRQEDADTCDLLTSWHIQQIVLPGLLEEEEPFDPMDKTQVDLSEHPNA